MTPSLNFGDVWLANLNTPQGTEPGKLRPVLIIQNQVLLNEAHPSTLVIPLTTNLIENAEPLRIRLKAQGNLEKDSDLLIDQLRAVDNKSLVSGPIIRCRQEFMVNVQKAILELIDYESF